VLILIMPMDWHKKPLNKGERLASFDIDEFLLILNAMRMSKSGRKQPLGKYRVGDVMNDSVHLIVMCKAPVSGFVKTRLSPPYSADEAAAIYRAMAETVISRNSTMFSNTWIAADDTTHPFFKRFNLPIVDQGEGDLGNRMTRLTSKAFAEGAAAVLFVGTDSPHMPESRLTRAVEMLGSFDAVVGPVEDGGYDLITMNGAYTDLFREIQWSSGLVLDQTLQRANASGISIGQLDVSFDLDTAESLERAKPLWSPMLQARK